MKFIIEVHRSKHQNWDNQTEIASSFSHCSSLVSLEFVDTNLSRNCISNDRKHGLGTEC